jgi:hypothetical protein
VKRLDEYYTRPLPAAILASDDPRLRQLFGLGANAPSIHGAAYAPGHPAFT